MTAPITPDERAGLRALADAAFPGPWTVIEDHVRVHGVGTNPGEKEASVFEDRRVGTADARFIAAARTAVPRLLDALDTAEAEAARLLGPHLCCEHCPEDPVHDVAPDEHEVPCPSCEADSLLGHARRERDEARAEALAKIDRQADRLRAREEQVRRLRAEVTRLHALVADLRAARPAPVWDEDTEFEAVDAARVAVRMALADAPEAPADVIAAHASRAILAVVREHLPVSGESRATVQAEALRDAAAAAVAQDNNQGDWWDDDRQTYGTPVDWLRARADRLDPKEK